jgi:hypothetical protein
VQLAQKEARMSDGKVEELSFPHESGTWIRRTTPFREAAVLTPFMPFRVYMDYQVIGPPRLLRGLLGHRPELRVDARVAIERSRPLGRVGRMHVVRVGGACRVGRGTCLGYVDG